MKNKKFNFPITEVLMGGISGIILSILGAVITAYLFYNELLQDNAIRVASKMIWGLSAFVTVLLSHLLSGKESRDITPLLSLVFYLTCAFLIGSVAFELKAEQLAGGILTVMVGGIAAIILYKVITHQKKTKRKYKIPR